MASIVPTSVMIPVNMRDALARAKVDVEGVGVEPSLIRHAPSPMRRRQVGKADVAQRRPAPADQYGRAVKQQPVHQISGEERGCGGGPAFHQQMVDLVQRGDVAGGRSEEHTSELQSLLPTSYAAF